MEILMSISKCGRRPAAMVISKHSLTWAISTKMDSKTKSQVALSFSRTPKRLSIITKGQLNIISPVR